MNFIDRVIGFFSPKAAYDREKFRIAAKVASDNLRKYEAASHGRRTKGVYAPSTSADAETELAITTLRNRSRDMTRNNPYAKRSVRIIANNVIGTGIRPSPIIDGSVEKKVKEIWRKWAEKKNCDFDGLRNFYGIQRKVMKTVAESGECLVVLKRTSARSAVLPIELQVLEPDFIDTRRNTTRESGKNFVKQGIEFDANGRRVAYWLYESHPGDYWMSQIGSIRVPISDICHIYEDDRPGQTRGVPFGHASMNRLRDFDEFEDAELMKQKTAACFGAFIELHGDMEAFGGDGEDEPPERLEPGMITHLRNGEKVSFASPPKFEGYDAYSKKMLQGIAAGYEITYEALTGDLSNVNFSSGRMGWLEFQRTVHDWQQMIITQLCEKVWEWFISGMQLKGILRTDVDSTWTPPRREMIDPSKEVKGITLAIRAGLLSWSEAVRQQGFDPEEVISQLKKDMDSFDENDLVLDIDGRKTTQGGQPVAPTEVESDGDDEDEDERAATIEMLRVLRGE